MSFLGKERGRFFFLWELWKVEENSEVLRKRPLQPPSEDTTASSRAPQPLDRGALSPPPGQVLVQGPKPVSTRSPNASSLSELGQTAHPGEPSVFLCQSSIWTGFPGGTSSKEPTCQSRRQKASRVPLRIKSNNTHKSPESNRGSRKPHCPSFLGLYGHFPVQPLPNSLPLRLISSWGWTSDTPGMGRWAQSAPGTAIKGCIFIKNLKTNRWKSVCFLLLTCSSDLKLYQW